MFQGTNLTYQYNTLCILDFTDEELKLAFLTFLHNYVRFADPKFNHIFMEELDQITGKSNTMGIIEYIREQKIISVVKNLLSGTDFSNEKIAAIAGVSVAFVEEVRTGKH